MNGNPCGGKLSFVLFSFCVRLISEMLILLCEPLLFCSQICLDREDCHITTLIILTQPYLVLQYLISSLHPLIDISFMLEAITKMHKIYTHQNNKENFSSSSHSHSHGNTCSPHISLTDPVSLILFFSITFITKWYAM